MRADLSPVLGDGPVYPIGFTPASTLRVAPAANFNSRRWGGNKVLWVRRPEVRGPVTIVGRRLDGPQELRFERGDAPPTRLVLADSGPDAWGGQPSYTRVSAPGCYAYTVRGRGIHETIVFRVVRS